ncbi:uncharacterized protein LOC125194950 [Salvia hispanica]|uniref:uncharacterized protein LOC125194950 n=1 Tax=Salvia hispanica TaxID=49212 RepID=UPI0020096830|nr:uncharacterized protein LOC125194950 [Salvia hispanica]
MDYRLTYFGFPSVLEGYSDASWITNMEDHSSTSGWVFRLGGGAICWASKKQTCITNSTMESEFVALAAAGKEAERLRNLIYEIPLWPKPVSPISIRCDSAATLANAYSQEKLPFPAQKYRQYGTLLSPHYEEAVVSQFLDQFAESVDLIGRIVEDERDAYRNQLRVQVSRAAEIFTCLRSNKQMMRRNVMAYLRNCGYNAAVCKTKWESSGGLSGGSYEFVDVVRGDSASRYVVDLDFAAEFAIARPARSYECLLQRLPRIYVGTAEELRQILRAASNAARWSMKCGGLILPPWRKHRFMQSKWLGPYRRTTSLISSAANRSNGVKCRAVGFDAAANGGRLVFPAAARTR